MYRDYEHTIVITNRGLVQGDFFEQMERVISLHPHAVILREKDLTDEAVDNACIITPPALNLSLLLQSPVSQA